MKSTKRLSSLKKGEKAKINSVLDSSLNEKLMEIGVYENAFIELYKQNIFGDPTIYMSEGMLFGIRKKDADFVEIEIE